MAVLLALASAGMWGTADFIGGVVSRRVRPLEVYGLSQIAGLLLMVVVILVTGESGSIPDVLGPGIATGVIGLVGMIAMYQALAIGPMGVVSPIAALGVIVPVAYALLLGESPRALQVLGIVLAIAGILLACGPELSSPSGLRPLLLAGVAAVSFGTAFIFMAEGSRTSAVATMTVVRVVAAGICVLAILGLRWRLQARGTDLPLIASAGVMEATANLGFGVASTIGLLAVTSVLSSLYPVVTVVLAAVVLRERLRPVQYAGVACAMVGVVLITMT